MKHIVLLVDFDGVIRRWNADDAAIEHNFGLPAGAIRSVAFAPGLLLPAITGEVSDEVWRHRTALELQSRYPGSEAADAVAMWSLSPGELDLGVLGTLVGRRAGLRLVLATNATTRLKRDLKALNLSHQFDAVANSSEFGAVKPSDAFFRAALQCSGASAAEALFVDDSRANVDAASAMGMLAHHFVGIAPLIAFLTTAQALAKSAP